jgi:hypothetical protein
MGITTYPVQAPKSYFTAQLTASGSFSIPATTNMIDVLLIGGGAGGAGQTRPSTANSANYVEGGAPGCIMYLTNFGVTPSSAISYTIGTAGAGGVASGTTAATFRGSAGGNTTFGGLVAPGGGVKIGSNGNAAVSYYRGGFGTFGGHSSDFSNNSGIPNSNTATWAGQDPVALGFPQGVPGAFVDYTNYYYNVSTAIASGTYPSMTPGGGFVGASQTSNTNWLGITRSFSRLLGDFTPSSGSSGGIAAGTTSGALPAGWAGGGAYGYGGSAGTTGYVAGGGGGGGGVYGLAANVFAGAGGAAAANSGSGGGGAAGTSGGSGAVQLMNGGAGGSGVIFIGYWA